MKVTKENIHKIYENSESYAYKLLNSLLDDLHIYNELYFPKELEIHYVTEHTEYSPEWTDPCPDYYGTFNIKWQDSSDTINDGLTLYELDNNMCTLCQAFEQINLKNINHY